MAAFSGYLEQSILGWVKGVVMPSSPSGLKLALHTTSPLDDFSGGGEVSGGGYSRQTTSFGSLIEYSGGTKFQNSGIIKFPPSGAATADWGSITHWSIHDDSDSQYLFYGEFQTPRNVFTGDSYLITSQELEIAVQGNFSKAFRQSILNWVKNTSMPTAPTGLLLALHDGDPLDDFSGSNEITAGGYSRQSLNLGSLTSVNGVGTVVKNSNVPLFGPATISWSDVTHGSIHSSGGSFLFFGQLAETKNIAQGESLDFKTDEIILTVR